MKIEINTEFLYDGIIRKIIEIEEDDESDYVCYYVDKPFVDGDSFFEKNSPLYNEILKWLNRVVIS
jgi:hypothetical protein